MDRKLFSLAVVGLFLYIAYPLLIPILMAAIIAVLTFPWLRKLESFKFSVRAGSGLVTLGVTLVFLLPAAFLVFLGTKAVLQQVRVWKETPHAVGTSFVEKVLELPVLRGVFERASGWFPVETQELAATAEDLARSAGLKIADILGGLVAQLPGMAMGLAIMVVSIYFFLIDGPRIVRFFKRISFFSPQETDQLIQSIGGMCRSVILATVLSGFAQSFLFSLACLILGVPNVALVGFLIFIASFVPLVGSFPMTAGVTLQQFLLGNTKTGIVLAGAAIIVGLVDNLIRPMVLKGAGNLHPLLAFAAAFGGLQVLGFSGVFLGPIVAGLLVVTINMMLARKS